MVAYLDEVKAMLMKIKEFKICQISKEENKKVDALANLASAFDVISDKSIHLEFLPNPSIHLAKSICQATSDPTWMDDIIAYLKEGKLPTDKLKAHRVQYQSTRVIISDNATQFDNERFKLLCSDLAISHHFSSPGHPQTNGQMEVTSRTILRNLKARLEKSKGEWAKTFQIYFGLIHDKQDLYGTSNFDKKINEVELRLNLDLFDKKRERAEVHQAAYKNQVVKYYNRGLSIDHSYLVT
ncbi:hypothetical protein Acr_00g0032390 [Actinidia rufa]|uniref:Integrase catalytic domain-containing protein n=1 Tax=Actinidia rufa TaxID=165716 RepID=A0A7J0DFD9_9ERIC|nr:hypothetical protein Acr_00g0032390 [Actinidia rufa]